MVQVLSAVVTAIVVTLSLLGLVYCLQLLMAILPGRGHAPQSGTDGGRGSVAVVIPAHDEGAGVVPILSALARQLRDGDRLIVVADNCSDDTAAQARSHGALVVERHDATRRGKGYALDFGVRQLEQDPPDMVVFFDADSVVEADALSVLADRCWRTGRPTQAKHVMRPVEGSRGDAPVACFGHLIKNDVRLLGLHRLGLPSHMTGSGFACPWKLIHDADLAHGHAAEDKKLGLDLAAAGHPVEYLRHASVWADAPFSAQGTTTQRERWERGHLSLISEVPAYLRTAIHRRDVRLLMLALDVAVPPMFLLIFLLTAAAAVGGLLAAIGGWALPVWIASATLLAVIVLTLIAWWRYGRALMPPRTLPYVAKFMLSKVALYLRGAFRSSTAGWIRTDRGRSQD